MVSMLSSRSSSIMFTGDASAQKAQVTDTTKISDPRSTERVFITLDPHDKTACLKLSYTATPPLSDSQQEYVEELRAFGPTDAILFKRDVMLKCKALGQEIFDKYKSQEASSEKALHALKMIFGAVGYNRAGVRTLAWTAFQKAVNTIWKDIGDATARWT